MRYQNESCALCGRPFDEGAGPAPDIVVCPDCGAPLHRACWKEHGGCPYAERHGSYVWQPKAPPEEDAQEAEAFNPKSDTGVICPVCGENCPLEAARCPNCDTHFGAYAAAQHAQRAQAEQQFQSRFAQRPPRVFTVNARQLNEGELLGEGEQAVPVEEAALHIRATHRSVQRYLGRFERNSACGWNWSAFLFGPYWCFFRKLYKPGILLAVLLLAMNLALAATPLCARYMKYMQQNEPAMTASLQAIRDADTNASRMTAVRDTVRLGEREVRQNAGYLAAAAAITLLPRTALALLADRLLRRKVWRDIAIAHEDSGGEAPEQKLLRQRILVRRGGMSLFAPMLFYWASYALMNLIDKLAT